METHYQNQQTTAGQGLGIAGLILGIMSLIIAFIPCVGLVALVPGFLGIVLSAIGLAQASQNNGNKGLIIAALVVSILGTSIAGFWGLVFGKVINESSSHIKEGFEGFEDAIHDLDHAMEEAGDEFDHETNSKLDELEEKMDELDENEDENEENTSNTDEKTSNDNKTHD